MIGPGALWAPRPFTLFPLRGGAVITISLRQMGRLTQDVNRDVDVTVEQHPALSAVVDPLGQGYRRNRHSGRRPAQDGRRADGVRHIMAQRKSLSRSVKLFAVPCTAPLLERMTTDSK